MDLIRLMNQNRLKVGIIEAPAKPGKKPRVVRKPKGRPDGSNTLREQKIDIITHKRGKKLVVAFFKEMIDLECQSSSDEE